MCWIVKAFALAAHTAVDIPQSGAVAASPILRHDLFGCAYMSEVRTADAPRQSHPRLRRTTSPARVPVQALQHGRNCRGRPFLPQNVEPSTLMELVYPDALQSDFLQWRAGGHGSRRVDRPRGLG